MQEKHEQSNTKEEHALKHERWQLLSRIERAMEIPMIFLGIVWLVILVIDLVWGLPPLLRVVSELIWVIFIVDFVAKLILAPDKKQYLKHNWLTGLSLAIPALRVFRIFRAITILQTASAARGFRLLNVIASVNRGMSSLSATMKRRAFGYVLALTLMILFAGAAAMLFFERNTTSGINTYGQALWWTAMVMTSIGSEYWPKSAEGRVLGFLLALYGFAVFGYFTATLATYFTGQDAKYIRGGHSTDSTELEEIKKELVSLQASQQAILAKLDMLMDKGQKSENP